MTLVYGSQPSSVVFGCKTATFGSELQVSMGSRLRLFISECKTTCLDPEWRLSIGHSLHLWFCAFKTATLPAELLVSMGPSPHRPFLHAKQRFMDEKYKSLWVPHLTYVFFCIHNSDFSTIIASLNRSQPSSVVRAFTTAAELIVSMGPRPHLSFCACKTTWLASELLVSIGPSPHLWFLHAKQRL